MVLDALITALNKIEYKEKNIPKIIDFLSVIRRKKKIKTYDLPEISKAVNFINYHISLYLM